MQCYKPTPFSQALPLLGLPVPPVAAQRLFEALDADGRRSVDIAELATTIHNPNAHPLLGTRTHVRQAPGGDSHIAVGRWLEPINNSSSRSSSSSSVRTYGSRVNYSSAELLCPIPEPFKAPQTSHGALANHHTLDLSSTPKATDATPVHRRGNQAPASTLDFGNDHNSHLTPHRARAPYPHERSTVDLSYDSTRVDFYAPSPVGAGMCPISSLC